MPAKDLRGSPVETLNTHGDHGTREFSPGDGPNLFKISPKRVFGGFLTTAELGPNWTEFGQLSFSTLMQLISKIPSIPLYNHTPSSTDITLQNTITSNIISQNSNCCIFLYVGHNQFRVLNTLSKHEEYARNSATIAIALSAPRCMGATKTNMVVGSAVTEARGGLSGNTGLLGHH